MVFPRPRGIPWNFGNHQRLQDLLQDSAPLPLQMPRDLIAKPFGKKQIKAKGKTWQQISIIMRKKHIYHYTSCTKGELSRQWQERHQKTGCQNWQSNHSFLAQCIAESQTGRNKGVNLSGFFSHQTHQKISNSNVKVPFERTSAMRMPGCVLCTAKMREARPQA